MRRENTFKRIGAFALAGIALTGVAVFAPDSGGKEFGSFFKAAISSSWKNLFDLPAAWCSVKIILLGAGFFLLIESTGTMLTLAGRKRLAWIVYCLHILPGLVGLVGGYCLIKALL